MGTLGQVKMRMKQDREMRRKLVRGGLHEILLDLDGDKVADLGLMDENMDGDIDMLAFDLRGAGDFDLFLADIDGNLVIDRILFDEEGNGEIAERSWGPEVDGPILEAASRLYAYLREQDWSAQMLEELIGQMSSSVAEAFNVIEADFT